MKPAALEIKLILSAPGMGWEYTARKSGEIIAASEEAYPHPGAAMAACFAEIKAAIDRRRAENGE